MTTKRRTYSAEFKAQVALEIISGAKSQAEVAREHHIKPDILVRWRRQFLADAASLFTRDSQPDSAAEARIAELERVLGQKTLELEAAKKASSIFRQLSGER